MHLMWRVQIQTQPIEIKSKQRGEMLVPLDNDQFLFCLSSHWEGKEASCVYVMYIYTQRQTFVCIN